MLKKTVKSLLVLLFTLGLVIPSFADPGMGKLNIWVSALDNPCGTWNNDVEDRWSITVLDCDGVFKWKCGKFLTPGGKWTEIPGGVYQNLPFQCGHLEVKLPPGTYWVVAAARVFENPRKEQVNFNKSTHVGIAQVKCNEVTCLKLFNPSIKLCWTWFKYGMYMRTWGGPRPFPMQRVERIDRLVNEIMREVPELPAERHIIKMLNKKIKKVKKLKKEGKIK